MTAAWILGVWDGMGLSALIIVGIFIGRRWLWERELRRVGRSCDAYNRRRDALKRVTL